MIKEKIKSDLAELIETIKTLSFILAYSHSLTSKYTDEDENKYEEVIYDFDNKICKLDEEYNIFYAKACIIISVVLPERLQEFRSCYIYDKKVSSKDSYRTISDYFNRNYETEILTPFEKSIEEHTYNLFIQQKNILVSAYKIIDSTLFNIQNILQYNLYVDELDAARDLFNKGFIRPAGVIASVTLEGHLKSVCQNNPNIKLKSKDTLGNFIEYLRQEGIVDVAEERKLRYLADIRNLCCHQKDREPTRDEILRLINDTKQVLVDV